MELKILNSKVFIFQFHNFINVEEMKVGGSLCFNKC
jgi:hypothetical protein